MTSPSSSISLLSLSNETTDPVSHNANRTSAAAGHARTNNPLRNWRLPAVDQLWPSTWVGASDGASDGVGACQPSPARLPLILVGPSKALQNPRTAQLVTVRARSPLPGALVPARVSVREPAPAFNPNLLYPPRRSDCRARRGSVRRGGSVHRGGSVRRTPSPAAEAARLVALHSANAAGRGFPFCRRIASASTATLDDSGEDEDEDEDDSEEDEGLTMAPGQWRLRTLVDTTPVRIYANTGDDAFRDRSESLNTLHRVRARTSAYRAVERDARGKASATNTPRDKESRAVGSRIAKLARCLKGCRKRLVQAFRSIRRGAASGAGKTGWEHHRAAAPADAEKGNGKDTGPQPVTAPSTPATQEGSATRFAMELSKRLDGIAAQAGPASTPSSASASAKSSPATGSDSPATAARAPEAPSSSRDSCRSRYLEHLDGAPSNMPLWPAAAHELRAAVSRVGGGEGEGESKRETRGSV